MSKSNKDRVPIYQVRFVYEGEIKGEWVNISDAINLSMRPSKIYVVERVEFRDFNWFIDSQPKEVNKDNEQKSWDSTFSGLSVLT